MINISEVLGLPELFEPGQINATVAYKSILVHMFETIESVEFVSNFGCGQGFSTPVESWVCCETDKKREVRGHGVMIQAVKRQLCTTIQNCRAFLRESEKALLYYSEYYSRGNHPN